MIDDTIAAIATAAGEAALSVIRLSGPEAFVIADRCFRPVGPRFQSPLNAPTHTIHYGKFIQPGQSENRDAHRQGRLIDEVLLTIMRAPRTFTKEDVAEISCHGGTIPTKAILDTLLKQGARLAEPGEFTRRAFLNGRIDLAQAEAVADVIRAKTELSLHAANQQLAGTLSRRIDRLRDDLLTILAHVEAHIDFPEEDIHPDDKTALLQKLRRATALMEELLASSTEGRILRHGLRAAIIGAPNAGKSSLLNRLLQKNRAIVSPSAGTTRDTIEETANIRGIPVVFIDTAGLRASKDEVEREGIRRSRESARQADLLLCVVDASQNQAGASTNPNSSESERPESSQTRLLVLNKTDLLPRNNDSAPAQNPLPPGQDATEKTTVRISCRTGEGLETLKNQIHDAAWKTQIHSKNIDVAINARHQNTIQRAMQAAQTACQAIEADLTPELIALDLRIASDAVGEIIGKTSTDDLLDKIFSQFCLGK